MIIIHGSLLVHPFLFAHICTHFLARQSVVSTGPCIKLLRNTSRAHGTSWKARYTLSHSDYGSIWYLYVQTAKNVCVCVSNPVSKDTTLVLVLTYPTNLPTTVQ